MKLIITKMRWNRSLPENMALAFPRPRQQFKVYQWRPTMPFMFLHRVEGKADSELVQDRHCQGKRRSLMQVNMKFRVVQIPYQIGRGKQGEKNRKREIKKNI